MNTMELQALVGRLVPGDIHCQVQYSWSADTFTISLANWCDGKESCALMADQLDLPEDMLTKTLKPLLSQTVKELRESQTKNRYSS